MLRRSFAAGLSLFAAFPLSVFAQSDAEKKFDLIIIGIGVAGLSTAVSAAQSGVKNTLLIDKAAFVGGHSALSGGSVNAVDPEVQMKQGIKDSPELWFRQIMEAGEFQSDPILVNTLVNNAHSTLHWLREIGIPFDDQVFEAWGGKFQRAHSAGQKRNGMTYVRIMNQKARSLGVKVRLRTEAVSLLENNGQVIGVRVKTREGKLEDLQAKDIVIATGGFTANVPMRLKYDERLDASLFTTANPTDRGFDGSTGDGILLAEKTGAQTVDMEAIQLIPLRGGRLLNYVGGDIFVDSSGKRFVDESKGVKAIGEAYLNLPDRVFWVITDSQSQKSLDLDAKLLSGTVRMADSVAEMAKKMHVSPKVLQETLDRYNKFAELGEDKDFGKKIFTQKIDKPPFYFGREQFDIHYSCGGLKINKKCQVIGKESKPIPNLYAVGEVTGGIHGRDRLGGDSLISCFVFGKIAGEEIAKKQKDLK